MAKSKAIERSHGGRRLGAGRPKGAIQRVSQEARMAAKQSGLLPHEILLALARGEAVMGAEPTPEQRLDAAKAAAPYYAPRLASAEVKHTGDPFEGWSAQEIQEAIVQVKAAVERAKNQQTSG